MTTKPVLYSYFRSSASWRVRIALAYKGIDYDYKAVHLVKGEQASQDYKALNAMAQVPSLIIDGATLTQSLPIIEYLEETRPGKNLLPKDPIQRAHARRIAEIINSGIQPVQNLSILKKIAEYSGKDDDKARWGNEVITKGMTALESEVAATAGTYCVGDEVTIADVALVPQIYNANRFKVDMSKFPIISGINERLQELDAFKQAAPTSQPDCPEELKN